LGFSHLKIDSSSKKHKNGYPDPQSGFYRCRMYIEDVSALKMMTERLVVVAY
jgi:hypothetical protein